MRSPVTTLRYSSLAICAFAYVYTSADGLKILYQPSTHTYLNHLAELLVDSCLRVKGKGPAMRNAWS